MFASTVSQSFSSNATNSRKDNSDTIKCVLKMTGGVETLNHPFLQKTVRRAFFTEIELDCNNSTVVFYFTIIFLFL